MTAPGGVFQKAIAPDFPDDATIPTLEQFHQSQYLTAHGFKNLTDASGSIPAAERIPTLAEFQQAKLLTGEQYKAMKVPALPKLTTLAADATARTGNPEKTGTKYSDQVASFIEGMNSPAMQYLGPVPGLAVPAALATAADVLDKWGMLAEQHTSPTSWTGTAVRTVAAPMLHHPWMTAGTIGATMIPVVGPVVEAAVLGDLASNTALYGYQTHLERQATPDARQIMEADPERVSGKAAVLQGLMAGLGGLVKGWKAADRVGTTLSNGFVAGGADALSGLKPTALSDARMAEALTAHAKSGVADAIQNRQFATDLARGVASTDVPRDTPNPPGFEPSGRALNPATVPAKRSPLGIDPNRPFDAIPRAGVSGKALTLDPVRSEIDPLVQSVRDYYQQRATEDLADLNKPADKPGLTPRRRVPGTVFEEPAGARLLGAAAANHGLPETASPYPPHTSLGFEWQEGHAEAMGEPLPLPAYPEGFSAGADLNAPSRIPAGFQRPAPSGVSGENGPVGSSGEGYSAGADMNAPPRVGPIGTQHSQALPEGATPETIEAAKNLPSSQFRSHSINDLADEVVSAHKAIADAQDGIVRAQEHGLVGEEAQAGMKDRGVSYADESEGPIPAKYGKMIATAKSRLAKLERELTLRGVGGDDLADVMKSAIERDSIRNEAALGEEDPFAIPVRGATTVEPSEPIAGEPKHVAAPDLINTEKLGLTSSAQDATIQSDLERLRANGVDREGVSLDKQTAAAKANIEGHLRFMLTDIDPAAAEKLSGAEIGQLYTELSNNAAQRTALLKEAAHPDISPDRASDISALIDTLQEQADKLSGNIVKGTAAKGRDLNYLRQVAQQSTDPGVWLAQAKRVLGGRPLDDEMQSLIVRLANDATEACA